MLIELSKKMNNCEQNAIKEALKTHIQRSRHAQLQSLPKRIDMSYNSAQHTINPLSWQSGDANLALVGKMSHAILHKSNFNLMDLQFHRFNCWKYFLMMHKIYQSNKTKLI